MSEKKQKSVTNPPNKKGKGNATDINAQRETKTLAAPARPKLTQKAWAIIVTVGILFLIIASAFTVIIIDTISNDKNFDYLKSDLSKYIVFSKDKYKDYDLSVDIAKPHEIDVDVAILQLLASKKGSAKHDGAMVTSPMEIGAGDVVYIYYRGYLIGEDKEQIEVSGMSNFSSTEASSLEIGSGQFIPGFELGLVGVDTGKYNKFEKIYDAEIKESMVAYISYTRLVEGGDMKKDAVTGTCVRVDLSAEDVDDNFGIGFKDQILAAKIGEKIEFSVKIDGKKHNYSSFTVDFVTECENNPIVVETYFPYDYSTTTLRNETAFFEVYVEGVVDYECPEFDDKLVSEIVSAKDSAITEKELKTYAGETLADKYRTYVQKNIDELYEEAYESAVEDAMWDYYLEAATVKKYPKAEVDKIYQEYLDDVEYQFEQTGGSLKDSYTEEYTNYEDIDSFAVAYLGLSYSSNKDWKSVLLTMSQSLVKERLILYYLMEEENLIPSEEKFNEEFLTVRQEYIDEYVAQYLDYEEKTREDYTDEEFEKFVKDREKELFDYYDESYFKETTYYEIALRHFLTWPKVSTLDERRAYPLDK